MSAIVVKEFDRNLRPRERHFGFPKIALRQRSAEHPMIMFFMVVVTAFTAMALVPSAGSAFASFGVTAFAQPAVTTGATAENTTGPTEIEIACHGQAWGAQDTECLTVIARESGRDEAREVRLIADAGVEPNTPNVF